MPFAPGTMVGQYRVTGPLGTGGMGEVHRARHIVLERDAALKTLPADRRGDAELNRRFILEARAASTLQHPNIVAIYDIAEWNGLIYIAMEYVEGITLRKLIARGPLSAPDAIRYAIQIAHGLNAVHRAGFTHRDIKPGNIMITQSDTIKVLDFGVAKKSFVQATAAGAGDSVTLTVAEPLTRQNVLVGTEAYMSPEQADGRMVDTRSDIFSFGAVLYEMLTGQRAFHGSSTISTLASVIRDEPASIAQFAPDVPRGAEEIVRLCMRKNPDERIQSMHDAACMLEMIGAGSSFQPNTAAPRRPARRYGLVAGAALVIAVAAGAGAAAWIQRGNTTAARPVLQRITWDDALDLNPTISSDGKLLAFASDRSGDGNMDIFVRYLNGGDPIRLTRNAADDIEPSFSPDGSVVAFESARDGGGVYVVPTLGGAERLLAAGGARPRFSPDGKWIAYWSGSRADPLATGEMFVIPATGGVPRRLAPAFAAARYPVWTPDGTHILFEGVKDSNGLDRAAQADWWVVPLDGGDPIRSGALDRIRAQKLNYYQPGGWRRGRVVFSALDANSRSIFEIPISLRTWKAEGPPEPVTFGSGTDGQPATSPGGQIVFAGLRYEVNVWAKKLDAAGEALPERKLTAGGAYRMSISLSADEGRMAYLFGRHPHLNVGAMDLRKGHQSTVTFDAADKCSAALSRDGLRAAWSLCGPGPQSVYAAVLSSDVIAGPPRKLCEDCGRVTDWSPADDRIAWVDHHVPPGVGILNPDSGQSLSFHHSRSGLDSPRFSPDGKWLGIAFDGGENQGIYAVPLKQGTPAPESEWIVVTAGHLQDRDPVWSAAGDAMYFSSLRDGFRCIWRQRVDPGTKRPVGEPQPFLHFHSPRFSMTDLDSALISLALAQQTLAHTLLESTGSIWILSPAEAVKK